MILGIDRRASLEGRSLFIVGVLPPPVSSYQWSQACSRTFNREEIRATFCDETRTLYAETNVKGTVMINIYNVDEEKMLAYIAIREFGERWDHIVNLSDDFTMYTVSKYG